MKKCERLTNILAIVHEIAGENKAKRVGARFGGSNLHIGHRSARVTEKNRLREILTDDEIFDSRRKFLDLEGKTQFGCITVPKTYTPGVLKRPMKRDQIIEMYNAGVYSGYQIMKTVGCSVQYFNLVVREIEMNRKAVDDV